MTSHGQYGIIRKVLKHESKEEQKGSGTAQYEVRLSQSLENVLVQPSDIRRMISVTVRIHSFQGYEAQNINIKVKVDSSILQLLQYISQIAQIAPNFINIYHKKKKLQNSDQLYKECVLEGDKLLCIQG